MIPPVYKILLKDGSYSSQTYSTLEDAVINCGLNEQIHCYHYRVGLGGWKLTNKYKLSLEENDV